MRAFLAILAVAAWATPGFSQEAPKPGPEHEVLKQMVGNWDLTMSFGGMESKGSVVYQMEVGGLWLVGNLKSELFGAKYTGKGLDTYDSSKKKYVGIWIDSMGTSPMILEGTYDKETKTMTMSGDGPGMDGKPTQYKSVTVFKDANTMNFSMYVAGGKEPEFTIVYKRKK